MTPLSCSVIAKVTGHLRSVLGRVDAIYAFGVSTSYEIWSHA